MSRRQLAELLVGVATGATLAFPFRPVPARPMSAEARAGLATVTARVTEYAGHKSATLEARR